MSNKLAFKTSEKNYSIPFIFSPEKKNRVFPPPPWKGGLSSEMKGRSGYCSGMIATLYPYKITQPSVRYSTQPLNHPVNYSTAGYRRLNPSQTPVSFGSPSQKVPVFRSRVQCDSKQIQIKPYECSDLDISFICSFRTIIYCPLFSSCGLRRLKTECDTPMYRFRQSPTIKEMIRRV